jgi:uncharacterized protein involved in outer membrane biogenesis
MKKKASIGKKIIIGVVIVVVLLIVVGIGGVIYLNHYLNSPEFLVKIREEARAQAGVDIQIGSLSASIFKGFVIEEVVLGSPAGGDPPIFKVDEIVLKYDLSDLLGKKITINKILIASPRIQLRKDAEGEWIIPGRGKAKEEEKPTPSGPENRKEEDVSPKKESAWKISIKSLQVTDGSVKLIMGKKYDPVLIEGVNLDARLLQLTEPREIDGRLDIDGIIIKGETLVSSLGADLHLQGMEELTAAIKAVVASGSLTGKITANLKDQAKIPYQAQLDLKEIDIAVLMKPFSPEEGGTKVTGKIFGEVKANGHAQDSDSLTAEGDLDIKDGTISENPIQNLLASLMNDDKNIKTITFDQADAKFTFKRMVLNLDRLIIHSHKVIITALGTIDYNQDQEMEMGIGVNFADQLVGDIKPKEIRSVFQPSTEFKEYQNFQFKVWGTPEKLENDLAARLVQEGASSWLKDELFKKDRKKEEDPDLTDEERKKKVDKREKKEKQVEDGLNKLFKLF